MLCGLIICVAYSWLELNGFISHVVANECGGILSKHFDDSCAKTMVTRSYVAENFGEDFENKFKKYERNYYRPLLDNSGVLTDVMLNLDSPDNSPVSNTLNLKKHFIDFNQKDVEKTNVKNLQEWGRGIGNQLEDNTLFYLDNTSASRDNIMWHQRTF